MLELLVGNDTAVITMLLLFITALLTKRVVPWYVHEEALNKLKKYEDAAPGLISEVNRLMDVIDKQEKTERHTTRAEFPSITPTARRSRRSVKPTRKELVHE